MLTMASYASERHHRWPTPKSSFPRSPCGVSIFNPPATPASPTPHYFPVSAKNSNSSTSDEGKPSSSPSTKSQYLGPYESRSGSPTFSHRSRAATPTSPMFVKLFNAKLNDYYNSREGLDTLSKTNSHPDEYLRQGSSSNASPTPGSNFLSPHISPCPSPAIREFRKKTSPSLINLKSPDTSPRTSQALSPTPYSPPSLTSSIHFNMSANSASQSPSNSSDASVFSFNTSDFSDQTTPALTPKTPRSPLSKSLMNVSLRAQRPTRPISPLVMNNPPEGKKKKGPVPVFRKATSLRQSKFL